MSTKINRSELWKQVKSIGNYGTLKWQSKTSEWQSFINRHYEALEEAERIRSFPVIEQIIIDKKEGNGETLKNHIQAQPVNSIIVVNNKQFTYTGNVNALVGQIYDEIDYLEEMVLGEVYDDEVEPEEDDQVYRFGDSNCLITPIREQLISTLANTESDTYKAKLKKMIRKVDKLMPVFNKDGATPELIQELSDATESKITVYEVISQTKRVFKAQKVQRKYKFKFQNISLNHVNLWNGTNEEVVLDSLDEIIDQLRENKQTYKFQKVNDYIAKVNTGLNTYIDKDLKSLLDAENEINDMTKDLCVTLKTHNNHGCLDLILNTIQTCGGKKIGQTVDPNTLKHIDVKQSYSQFQSLPFRYRHGFAYLTDYRKVSSVDFAIKHNGFYKLEITSTLPAHINVVLGAKPYYVLASNIIQYLSDNAVQMKIDGGVYGKHSKQLTLNTSAYSEHLGRKAYYTAFSKYAIVKDTITENIYCPDQKLAGIIYNNVGYRMVSTGFTDPTYSLIIKKEEKDNIKTKAHVYGYVLQCQMLHLMLQLEKMQMDKVKLIYGDDIYYQDHKFEKLDIFREKGENKYKDLIKNTDSSFLRIPHFEHHTYFDFGEEERVYHQYQLHQGPGGFGKTYARLQDKGSINLIYTTLTNKLVNEQRQSIFRPKCYTTEMFQAKFQKFKISATNIIIDEIGLCETGIIKFIKRNMPYARIYVLGDDLQIAGRTTNPFDHSLYDYVLDESNFTTDFRAKNCPKLQELKKEIRKAMREGKNEHEIYVDLVMPNSQKVTVKKWIDNYHQSKMIITCSNQQKDVWVDRLQDKHEKYRACKSFVHNGQQYYTGDILDSIPEGFDFERNLALKLPYLKQQFAFTCHSLQGSTFNNQLLVQLPINLDLFRGYCYTAVSRLTQIEDLFTLVYKLIESK